MVSVYYPINIHEQCVNKRVGNVIIHKERIVNNDERTRELYLR